MRQVVQNLRRGEVSVVDVPAPMLRPGGALVATLASVISAGTERSKVELGRKSLVGKARARPDLARQVVAKAHEDGVRETWRTVMGRLDTPAALGYSASGIVRDVSEGCGAISRGDLVACAGGGYANHAEVNFVPANLLARVPTGVSPEQAAYGTLGAIALHSVRQAELQVGGTVAVIGLGLIGLLAVQVARASGVRVLGIDVDPSACPLASQLGAEQAVARSEAVEEVAASLSEGVGMDAVIVCASTPSADPLALAGSLARDRGRVVVVGAVGMTLPRDRFYEKELELRMSRSYGPGRYDPSYEEHGHDYPPGYVRWTEQRNLAEFLRLIASGDVDVDTLTTHRLRVEQAADAYALVSDGPADGTRPLGVVLAYDGTGPVPRAGDTPPPQRTPGRPRRDTVGIGLVGAGSFATRILIPALADDRRVELVGVATATGVTASHVASRFGFGFASSDPAALIGHEDVDAVVVATRHDSHADLTARALAAGKPVFCEKPLATTTDGLERVAGAARESGAPLLVGFNRRFSPLTASLRTILPTGVPRVIGYRVNAGMPVQGHWTGDPVAGGGRLTGEVCHFLDFACHIAEGPPAEVGGTELGAGGDRNDSVILLVRFACGSVASIQYLANGDRAVPKERIEVFCGGVVATLDDFRRLEIARDGRRRREGGRRPQKGHREEMRAFVDLALGRASDVQSLEAALWSSALTLQAAPALRAGCGVPVDFPGYGPTATAVRDSAE